MSEDQLKATKIEKALDFLFRVHFTTSYRDKHDHLDASYETIAEYLVTYIDLECAPKDVLINALKEGAMCDDHIANLKINELIILLEKSQEKLLTHKENNLWDEIELTLERLRL
jgi:hypothetical protein